MPAPFGKYHLLERMAVGGMAEIFLAKSFGAAGFERLLVIKKILPHMAEDDEFITMFIDEARIASTLTHSNIIQITELGKEGTDYYIAMEYVMGKDLSRVGEKMTQRKSTIPIPLAVLVTSRICEGLEYAHRKKDSTGKSLNIIHRDISPGNVIISYDGDVKLIDFGIAKAQNRMGRTTAGTLKGKFGYMSPEQVRGMPLDHRSDIFSVGILLYELLTGERLFGAESDFGTLEKVRNAQVVPPTTYNSKIPDELERVVLQALAREPEERYEWPSDMQEDLVRFLMQDGSLTTSKSLAAFMRDLFKKELARENEKMTVYRKRGYPWVDEARGEGPERGIATTETPSRTEASPDEAPDLSEPDDEAEDGEGPIDQEHAPTQVFMAADVMGSAPKPAPEAGAVVVEPDGPASVEVDLAAEAAKDDAAAPKAERPAQDEQLHQPTMVFDQQDLDPGPAPGPDEDTGEADAQPGQAEVAATAAVPDADRRERQRAARQRRKRPVRGRTGTDYMGGRRGRALPEDRPTPAEPSKVARPRKKSSALALVLTFVAGLGLAGGLGYFLFVHDSGPTGPAGQGVAEPIRPPAEPVEKPVETASQDPLVPLPEDKPADPPADKPDEPPADAPDDQPAGIDLSGGVADAPSKPEPPSPPSRGPGSKADSADAPSKPKPQPKPQPKPEPKPEPKPQPKPEPKPQPKPRPKPQPKPRPKPRRVAKATGARIRVVSSPAGADIILNGKPAGKTPKTIKGLDVSKNYFVVLRKKGYKKAFEGVKFKGKKKARIDVELKPAGGAKKPAATAAAGTGFLVANTTPWAKVIIDGKDTGKWTPIVGKNKIKLPAGKHVITFRTKEGKKLVVKVDVKPGKTVKVIKKIE